MATLIKNIDLIATFNDAQQVLVNSDILIEDGIIKKIGKIDHRHLNASCDILDLSNHIAIPGLINTHHHLFQNMTRAIPRAQNANLFGWLQTLYPIWRHLTPEHMYMAAAIGFAELVLSGCTTSVDHQYLFPNGSTLDDSISAALDIGIRFIATRGSMSIGESKGGLPPDDLCENENHILKDCERVIQAYHDPNQYAMINVAIAPCSPFSVSQALMRDSAIMAKEKKVGLHTHLAENDQDIEYSLKHFKLRPGDYIESLGWVGENVWHAHCVHLNQKEIDLFAKTKTGIAHCPSSNMRLGSGIAPVRAMLDCGVNVGLGVDGSASNDSAHMLNETRQAMLLQRVNGGQDPLHQHAGNMAALEVLHMATRGGAAVLNRNDIGQITPGYCADIAFFDRNIIELSGTQADPIAGLVFGAPLKPHHVMIQGKMVVQDGCITTLSLSKLLAKHACLTNALLDQTMHWSNYGQS